MNHNEQPPGPRKKRGAPGWVTHLTAALILAFGAPAARAEEGLINLHLGLGAGILASGDVATGVQREGLDFSLKLDYAAHRFIAPQLGYQLTYLPGRGAAEAGVNFIFAGARVRILNDEGGSLANLWPARRGGNAWGNLWVDFMLGYARAPTVGLGADWFALSLAVGYEFSLMAPLQMGPYISYQQVLIPGSNPAFVSFGVSISFGVPKALPRAGTTRSRPQPRSHLRGEEGDRDGDHVRDEDDDCPSTAPGATVDKHGCEHIRGRMRFKGLGFTPGKAALTATARLVLRRVAELINVHPELTVEINGHVHDDELRPGEVLKLSFERAKAVRAALVALGIPKERLRCQGRGDSDPLVGDLGAEGRRKNNRIEFRFSAVTPPTE